MFTASLRNLCKSFCFPLLVLVSGDILLVCRRLYFKWYSTLNS
ncbi:hypothetical protein AtEden1_Chr1g0061601 [Arabidopsis thaliana]